MRAVANLLVICSSELKLEVASISKPDEGLGLDVVESWI
jgi:hypothetical protein